ncbi:MAG: tRNA (adenosine(37)-N6)-threonylcarbamoyltransferase complex dimerization subunit type 1 TsaB [Thiotrichaceae bacterium]|nr:tRNA (adenosine(37)-N6)-threonylcarbamoyltransferase complex dimerization subunit type 1 TsaB [Thiotrichaceae bacterium]
MKILAIETATSACSAALLIDDEIKVEFKLAPREHTRLILPMVELLLQDADLKLTQLDAIAFSRGPGAFTGLRIATGVTQGLALAADLAVIPVSTLAAMAQSAYHLYGHSNVVAALDARIAEVYWGQYYNDNGIMKPSIAEQVCKPSETPLITIPDCCAVGSAWAEYAIELNERQGSQLSQVDSELNPSAEFIALLAVEDYQQQKWVDASEAQPIYLRDNVAQTIAERQKNA